MSKSTFEALMEDGADFVGEALIPLVMLIVTLPVWLQVVTVLFTCGVGVRGARAVKTKWERRTASSPTQERAQQ